MEKINDFYDLCNYVKKYSIEDLIKFFITEALKPHDSMIPKDISDENLLELFNEDIFKKTGNDSDFFFDAIKDFKSNNEEYIFVYDNLLSDDSSKSVYFNLLFAKITGSFDNVNKAYNNSHYQYYDPSIFEFAEGETLVDCGGYDGETAIRFAMECPLFKHIYVYEAIPQLKSICETKLKQLVDNESITIKQVAVSDKECTLNFRTGDMQGDSKISASGNLLVQATSLDLDISEEITFIKMDIEGAEKAAIEGAKGHIQKSNPKLAICIYHIPDDFWKIPKIIYKINPNYKFLIRHHKSINFEETVLYCVPSKIREVKSISVWDDANFSLRCQRIIQSYLNYLRFKDDYTAQLEDSKVWLLSQAQNYFYETKNLSREICELRDWNKQLADTNLNLQKEYDIVNKQLTDATIELAKPWYAKLLNKIKK